jgi:hypothetical protein
VFQNVGRSDATQIRRIAFYYGLAGLACAWYFRKQALTSVGKFIFLLVWPLLGPGFCIFMAAYSVPTFDLTTNVVGIGSIAIGIVPYFSNRRSEPQQLPRRLRRQPPGWHSEALSRLVAIQ